MSRTTSSVVERMQLRNFSCENDIDKEWHSFFNNVLRPQDHVRNVEKILEAMLETQQYTGLIKNLQSAINIAGRYHREKTELELALLVMDYKLSKLAQFVYDKLAGCYTPDALEELDRFFARIGLTRDHPLGRREKAKRPHVRLVK